MKRSEIAETGTELAKQGFVIRPLQTDELPKATYYTKDGRAMVLPADPVSLRRYQNIGFTLSPPAKKVRQRRTKEK